MKIRLSGKATFVGLVVAFVSLQFAAAAVRNVHAAVNDKATVTVGISPSLSSLGVVIFYLSIPEGATPVSSAAINEAVEKEYLLANIPGPQNHVPFIWLSAYGITTSTNPIATFEYDIPAGQTPSFSVNSDPNFVSLADVDGVPFENPLSRLVITTTFQHPVNVTVAGAGSGTITSSPGIPTALSCVVGTCTSWFDRSGQVTLTPVPSIDSYFKGWTGGGCAGTGNCVIPSLAAAADIQAEFARYQPVRIAGTSPVYYDTPQAAYNAAATGAVIQAMTTTSAPLGPLIMNGGKAITLKGGFNGDYTSNAGYTTTVGTLTIVNGTLIVENVVVN